MSTKIFILPFLISLSVSTFCLAQTGDPIVNCIIGSCNPATKNTNNQCEGFLNLSASATDDLTPSDDLLYSYTIDLYNNGIIDAEVSPLSKKQFANGEKPLLKNPFAKDPNNPFDASGTYPIGSHKICWEVKDGDGNRGNCCKEFEIQDCEAPTPYCLPGIIHYNLNTGGFVDIFAKDLNNNSYDNCSNSENLAFYFDGDRTKKSIRINCVDLAQGLSCELQVDIQFWAEDEEGNRDYCKTSLLITDQLSICPCDEFQASIEGFVKNYNKESICGVAKLYSNNILIRSYEILRDGLYKFWYLTPGKYTIEIKLNSEPYNGVSTADIFKIRRHILSIETFSNLNQWIAADVNLSNSITAADLAEIRKLILGNDPEFKKVPSWVFVPLDSFKLGIVHPSQFNTTIPFEIKDRDIRLDFIGIKMGDVNGTARACD